MTNNYIKNFRKRFGWSQEKLAEQTGVSSRTIQNWESGRTLAPRWVMLVFAAIAYNLPPYKDNNDK